MINSLQMKRLLLPLLAALALPTVVNAGRYDCEYRWPNVPQVEPFVFKVRKEGNQYISFGKYLKSTFEHKESKDFLVLYKTYSAEDMGDVDVRIINKNTLAFVISNTQIIAEGMHKGDGNTGFGRCKKVNNE